MDRDEARRIIDDYGTELMYFGMDLRDEAMLNPMDKIYDEFEEEKDELIFDKEFALGLLDTQKSDFELRDCENCKLQYDKYCPIAETNHDFKYCSEWELK